MEDSRQGGSKYHRPSSSSTSSLPFSYLLSSSAPLGFCSLPFLRPGRWCRCFSLPLQHHLICLSLVLAAVLRISQEVSGNALANVKDSESLRLSFLNECPCLTCRPGRDYCGHTSILAVFPKSLAKKLTVEHLERELDQVLFENPQARPTSTLSSLRRAFSTVTRRIGERKQTRSPRPEGAPRVRIARWSHGIPQGRFSWLKPWRLVSRFAWRRRKQTSDIHLVPLRPSASLHDVLRVKPDLLVFPADVEEEVLRMRVTRFQELALDTEGLKTLPETCTSEGCFRTATLVALEGASTRPLLRKRRMIRCILGVGYGVPIRSILQVLERNAGTPFLPLRYGSPLSVSESESRASVGSPPSASWGGHNLSLEELGPDDLFLRTPDVLQLSLLFPSTFYFPVRLNEDFPAFNIDVEQMHIFPTSLSTYKCSSTQFRMFTPQGLADLQRALSAPYLVRGEGKMYKRMAAALAARRPGNIEREQDPTVVLHQWWRRENDEEEEIWTETPLQWAFPDLQ
ncbi:phosphatidylserine decarboxylase [Cystoisospora suis]|uniref:Phosphatidylserine decarboxylase n=1 Tax=Cystoisospora suis TaxID=483139 RepID=A0A2C6L8S5_9APIC|nr:phosphatidylserine decarboxylase [Cystoisospora suis]